jgi:acyl dehydratase
VLIFGGSIGGVQLAIYFEDIEIGKVRTAGPFELTKQEIVEFAKKWDPLPFHIDEQAANNSVFGGFSASGSLKIAIANRLLFEIEHAAIIAALAHEYSYPNPAMAGDKLYIETTAIEKTESKSQPDKRGMVRGETLLKNQDGVIVLEMKSLVMVETKPRAVDG